MNTADIRNYAFQDTAGTVPAVNEGDPVRLLVCHLTGAELVAPLPPNAPTLGVDSEGRYCLRFDGVDDILISTSSPPPVLRGGMVAFGSVTTGPTFPPEHFPKPKPVESDTPTIVTG